jgi:hypothetical protein
MASVAVRQPLVNRVSWGALFAGFFFGFGIWMLLLALGAGIGFAAFDPRDLGQWQGLGIGFGIWGVISGIVAMFLAGWLCARLSSSDTRPAGMLHGAALWGFMVVAGLWLATMAVAGTAGAAARAAGGAAQAAGEAAGQDPELRREAQERAGQAQQQLEGLKQQATENKDEAAAAAKKAGTTGAWAFFLYGVLTLAAAIIGGRVGVPKERLLVAREERVPPPGEPLPHRA